MADVVLCAELKSKGGHAQIVRVPVQNTLAGLVRGISELNVNVSQLLTELVQQEKVLGACAVGEEVSDEDDEQPEDPPDCQLPPPTKRLKASHL